MEKVNEDDKRILKICRITRPILKFTILKRLNWPSLAKLTYQITKLTRMGLIKRVSHGNYRLTKDGKAYCR